MYCKTEESNIVYTSQGKIKGGTCGGWLTLPSHLASLVLLIKDLYKGFFQNKITLHVHESHCYTRKYNKYFAIVYETAPYNDRLPAGCARCLNVWL